MTVSFLRSASICYTFECISHHQISVQSINHRIVSNEKCKQFVSSLQISTRCIPRENSPMKTLPLSRRRQVLLCCYALHRKTIARARYQTGCISSSSSSSGKSAVTSTRDSKSLSLVFSIAPSSSYHPLPHSTELNNLLSFPHRVKGSLRQVRAKLRFPRTVAQSNRLDCGGESVQ